MRQTELVERVRGYDPQADEDILNKAYVFAMQAHGPQKRASGDPYFSHPLQVAAILTDLKLDTPTIATALLHDTVEDTSATIDDIRGGFGDEIAGLVDGVTKLSKIEVFSERTKQAENFRKLMLAMSNDIRVLLVKLADRLHNMRTLGHIKNSDKRRRIAQETPGASACRTCARNWKTWPSPNSIPKRANPSCDAWNGSMRNPRTRSTASPAKSRKSSPAPVSSPRSTAAPNGLIRSGAS